MKLREKSTPSGENDTGSDEGNKLVRAIEDVRGERASAGDVIGEADRSGGEEPEECAEDCAAEGGADVEVDGRDFDRKFIRFTV